MIRTVFKKYASAGSAVILFFLTVLHAAGSIGASNRDTVLYEGDSIYNHITVRQSGDERCMLFGRYREGRETCIRMGEPDYPVFEYTRIMFVGFLFHPATKTVALLGLGGGYMSIVFGMHLPDVRLDTVEVDPLVVELARKHFNFATSPNVTLSITDGRQYLKQKKLKYDQIWVDTFNSDYIPAHMTTEEFLQLAKSRLTEQGIVVQNVHKGNRLYDAHIATFRSVFKHVFIFGGRVGNAILIGAENPAHMPEGFAAQAARFNGRIGKIDLMEEAGKLDPGFDVRPAKVLTDDYAPANLLLHRK